MVNKNTLERSSSVMLVCLTTNQHRVYRRPALATRCTPIQLTHSASPFPAPNTLTDLTVLQTEVIRRSRGLTELRFPSG